jgi:S-adenosyl-L-methionine hydrolase (adenosine-forming)
MPEPSPRIVTLTTDFGTGSGYVAELKGRLLHARRPITLVDIAHDVPAHDVPAAAWLVARACPAFPPGALHLIVVDPGVGTARRVLWVKAGGQEYLAPDNGLLSRVLAAAPAEEARVLHVPAGASTTFHGRDVIAPAAAALVEGAAPESLGPAAGPLVRLPIPAPRQTPAGIEGEVVAIDAFGNLLTNLPADLRPRLVAAGRLIVGDHEVARVVGTYGDAPPGTPVALVGSQGVIEAAVVQGRADASLTARIGTRVFLP